MGGGGTTLGKMPPKNICRVGSCKRWFRDIRPRFSDRSWNRILIKMRLLDVVSSSVSRMHDSTDQLIASVVNKCCGKQHTSSKCISTAAVAAVSQHISRGSMSLLRGIV